MKILRISSFLLAILGSACLLNAQSAGPPAGGASGSAGQALPGGLGGAGAANGQAGAAGQAGVNGTGGLGAGAGQLGAGQPGAGQAGAELGNMNWNPYGQSPWFNNPYFAERLRLNPELREQLQSNYQQNYRQYQEALNNLPGNLPADELARRRELLAQQFENNFSGSLDKSIPDQTQRQRFQQMMTQYQGLNAFDNPTVVQRLSLSTEQRRQINRMQQEWRRTMARLSRANGNLKDFDWNDFYRRSNLSVDEILSPEQLQTWREIRGESVNIPADAYFRTRPNDGELPNNDPNSIPNPGVINGVQGNAGQGNAGPGDAGPGNAGRGNGGQGGAGQGNSNPGTGSNSGQSPTSNR